MNAYQRIPRAGLLLLLAAFLALSTSVAAFNPSMPGGGGSNKSSGGNQGNTLVKADAPPVNGGAAATTSPSSAAPKQSEYGKSLELPDTYASCGQCGSTYALTQEAMGEGRGGRRMECSVCGHTWFQSRERLATLGDGFEMIPLPERDMDRIKLNIKEGRHPKHYGDFKMYVGNISFQCTEADLFEVFETIGPVGDVSLVRDETGRPRGFGFITMRNKDDGERALEELDGTELKGRNLNVRPSTN